MKAFGLKNYSTGTTIQFSFVQYPVQLQYLLYRSTEKIDLGEVIQWLEVSFHQYADGPQLCLSCLRDALDILSQCLEAEKPGWGTMGLDSTQARLWLWMLPG